MSIIIILAVICFIVKNITKYYIKGSMTHLDKMKFSIKGKLPEKYNKPVIIMLVSQLVMWICIILIIAGFLIKILG